MKTAGFAMFSAYSRWPSRFADAACLCINTSGMSSRWAVGHLPLADGIAAISSAGMAAMESYPFKDHFTLVKAAIRDHHQSRMSGLVFLLPLILLSMSRISSSHTQTPNQSLEPTAGRCNVHV